MGSGFSLRYRPEVTPDPLKPSAFDPSYGFQQPRKERGSSIFLKLMYRLVFFFLFIFLVMIATEEEMVSAKLLLDERDFCAHKLIDYKACRADVWPWVYKCAPEKHEYLNCQYEE